MKDLQLKGARKSAVVLSSLLTTAAMLLPAVPNACADAVPEQGVFSMRYLNYNDSQVGDTPLTRGMSKDRIEVNALSFMVMAPVADQWSITTTLTGDMVSGASPTWHGWGFPPETENESESESETESGASESLRHAGDFAATRYFSRGTLTVGANYSDETDYLSLGCSLNGTLSTESNNTTFSFGTAYNNDTIDLDRSEVVASQRSKTSGKKRIYAGQLGVTQVLSQNDIAQVNVTYRNGNGYFSDPYKENDHRPGRRNMFTFLSRWNHHFDGLDGTTRLSYRFYSDTFSITAHTFEAEYVQPLPKGWEITPMVRYYSQSAADFYVPTGSDPKVEIHLSGPGHYSEDQRLSAFGSLSCGVKVSKEFGEDWLADVQYEYGEQHYDWGINGKGDAGIPTFKLRNIQIGLTRKF